MLNITRTIRFAIKPRAATTESTIRVCVCVCVSLRPRIFPLLTLPLGARTAHSPISGYKYTDYIVAGRVRFCVMVILLSLGVRLCWLYCVVLSQCTKDFGYILTYGFTVGDAQRRMREHQIVAKDVPQGMLIKNMRCLN